MKTPTREEFERKTRPFLWGIGHLISLAELYHLTRVRLRETARPVLCAFSAFLYASLLTILFDLGWFAVNPAMLRLAEDFRILSACVFAGMAVLVFIAGILHIGETQEDTASPGKIFAADLASGLILCLFAAGSILISNRICDSFSLTGRLTNLLVNLDPGHVLRDLHRLEDIVEGEWKWLAVLFLLNAMIFSGTVYLTDSTESVTNRSGRMVFGLVLFGILADAILILLGMLILPGGQLHGLIPSSILGSTPLLILIFLLVMAGLAAVLYLRRREQI